MRYDVVFATLREYQIREIGLVARELWARGLRTAFLDGSPRPDRATIRTVEDGCLDLVPFEQYVAGRAKPSVLVVRSEVNRHVRGLVEHGNRVGIATAAIAHPVINFTRHPVPYAAASVVLCAGRFSEARMHRKGLVVTGFPGFDDLSKVARRPASPPLALVNLSLPRGLDSKGIDMGAVRTRWMAEVRRACDRVGLAFVVSRHPKDTGETFDWPMDARSVYDILPGISVLVSPPSTVLMEAMAMGIPAICHRDPALAPFEMDTFDEPHGAFRNTLDESTLVAALRAEIDGAEPLRDRFRPFLAEHVSVEPGRSMTVRVADVLTSLVSQEQARRAR